MALQPITRQLDIKDGTTTATSSVVGLYTQSPPASAARGRQKDILLLHLDLNNDAPEFDALVNSMAARIATRFYATSGSVTAALRQAIVAGNEQLLEHNTQPGNLRLNGSVVCAVIRDQETFIAQAGDSFAIIGHSFGLERLPNGEPEINTPLGLSVSLDVRFFHNWVQAGDTLLLGGPQLGYIPTQQFVSALAGTDLVAAENELVRMLSQNSARALIALFAEGEKAFVATPPPAAAAAVVRPKTTPSAPTPPRRAPVRDPAFAAATATTAVATRPTPTPAPVADDDDALEDDFESNGPGLDLEYTSRRAAATALGGLSVATGWLARMLARLKSPEHSDDESHQGERTIAVIIAVAIPLLVAIILTGVYIQRGEVSRMTQIQQEIQIAFTNATSAEITNQDSRLYYDQVVALTDEALQLSPGNNEMLRYLRDAQVALDGLDDITRLFGTPLYIGDENSDLTHVVLAPDPKTGIFVIDAGNERVDWLPTDESYLTVLPNERETIVQWNDVIGSYIIENIVDMIWRDNASEVAKPGLTMLDSRGAIVTYNPNSNPSKDAATLALSSEWGTPESITDFQGRIYVLDPARERIWRYFPDKDGFKIEGGREAIQLEGLATATDTEIYDKDGSVILVYSDGAIRQYIGDDLTWDESRLTETGLGEPLGAPNRVKIIGDGFSSSVFVADPATARIIELGPSGNVLAQYKATRDDGSELFADIVDFDVAPSLNELRIFVVSGNELSVATFAR